jgi:hypothetical protein
LAHIVKKYVCLGRFWTFLDGTPKPDVFSPVSAFAGIVADAGQLCQVPPGSFTGFNRISGAALAGKVF